MSEKQQEVLMQAVKESADYERERSTYYEDIILKNMRDYGTVITELTNEDKAVWKERILGSGIYDAIKAQM